jgi:hypothetical protein
MMKVVIASYIIGLQTLTLERRWSKSQSQSIPIFDLYKLTFSVCDRFNKNLCHRTWPHKKGGKSTPGAPGVQHDFMFSVLLQNVFNCYLSLNRQPPEDADFKAMCLELADNLFEFANNMV